MRRILYIQYTNPAAYPPLGHSSRILAEREWKVLFLGTGARGADALEFPPHPRIEVRRWKFVAPGLAQKLHFLLFNFWVSITAVWWRPDWIYASDFLAGPAALGLKRIGFRVIYHEHDSPDPGAAHGMFQKFLFSTRLKLARLADICILPNEKRVEDFVRTTGRPGTTLCVWNCPGQKEAELRPAKSATDFVIFYHGSIVPERLPPSVVQALAKLPATVRLRVAGYETVGHPNYIIELQKLAESVEVLSRFEYIGSLSRAALLPETRKAHIGLALMPISGGDINIQAMVGASNKPFEYIACGLALLVSDLPDWSKMFVEPGYAKACNPDSAEGIAAALRWFIENPSETRMMGERGRSQILNEWNYEMQFTSVLNMINGK